MNLSFDSGSGKYMENVAERRNELTIPVAAFQIGELEEFDPMEDVHYCDEGRERSEQGKGC